MSAYSDLLIERDALMEQRDSLAAQLAAAVGERDEARISDEVFEHGFWRPCSGCHESDEGHPTGPYSETFRCNLGIGCYECGGLGATWEQMMSLDDVADVSDEAELTTLRAALAEQVAAGEEMRKENAGLLASVQRESAWVNEYGGVVAFTAGVFAEIVRAKTVEDARTFAEIAQGTLAEYQAGTWKPGPHDDAANWKATP